MDERINKYFANELNKDERLALLKDSLANRELKKEFIDYQNIETLFNLHTNKKSIEEGKDGYKHLLQKIKHKHRKLYLIHAWKYAAIIILCVCTTWWIHGYLNDFIGLNTVSQELYVPPGQRAKLTLPDGSQVWVNAGSTLKYPSVFGKERRISLVGEAFFKVAKGKKPFIVSTGKLNVMAVGTQFNVFNYPNENLAVSLLEGVVKIYKEDKINDGIILHPNQKLIEQKKQFYIQPITENPIIWTDGLFAFHKEKLKNILRKMELYYDVRIITKDPSILEYEYTGKFRQKDGIMELLNIIQRIHPFIIERDENQNIITLYR